MPEAYGILSGAIAIEHALPADGADLGLGIVLAGLSESREPEHGARYALTATQ